MPLQEAEVTVTWLLGMIKLADDLLMNRVEEETSSSAEIRIVAACRVLQNTLLRAGVRDPWPVSMKAVSYYSGMFQPSPIPPVR
jgi:hypothetical protein